MPNRPMRRAWRAAVVALACTVLPLLARAQDDDPLPLHRREEAARKAASLAHWLTMGKALGTVPPAGFGVTTLTPNQLSYNVTWYKLVLDLNPTTTILTGTGTVRGRVVNGPLSQIELDLDAAMVVSATRSAGAGASFAHPGNLLVVQLGRAYANGELFTVEVDYAGTPNPNYGSFGFSTRSGQPLIWSLSEPFGARAWWPCKDDPSDKADSSQVVCTVPSTLVVASNGVLKSTVVNGPKKTFTWKESFPIAAYLISVTAHPYTVQTVNYLPSGGGSMPVTVWSYPDQAASALTAANTTVQILGAFAARFGEYPFVSEKYGMANFPWGGGMEHQTCTSLCCWSPSVVSHELCHQWYGDAITCRSFSDIWLNEGFATYGEALWDESQGGTAAYWTNILLNRFYGGGTVYVPPAELDDFNRIFDGNLSYNKGSWVLHMLRGLVGDTTFFNILRTYSASPTLRYNNASTADFESVAESVSGFNLTDFFHDWIYVPYCPTYAPTWSATPSGPNWNIALRIDQLQTHEIYSMPMRVRVTTTAGTQDFLLSNNQASQNYVLVTSAQPQSLALDPDQWILRTVENPIGTPTFHRGVLLVNGGDWVTYDGELVSAYQDSVFSGRYPFSFWDCFPTPAGGYAAQLPAPLGHGALPASTLGQFSTVIWMGNNLNGDLDVWNNAAILRFLQQGGNVLLLGRLGQDFLSAVRGGYPGIRWAEATSNSIQTASAAMAGMVAMPPLGVQNTVAVFETQFDQDESVLLLTENLSFSTQRALGVWRQPQGGGTLRHSGGNFAYIAGRPYRWNHAALRANVQTILSQLFHEPTSPTAATPVAHPRTRLDAPTPNPFNPRVTLRFALAEQGVAQLSIYDARGRLVRTLLDGVQPAGEGQVVWDGRDQRGRDAASGVYVVRLVTAGQTQQQKASLIR